LADLDDAGVVLQALVAEVADEAEAVAEVVSAVALEVPRALRIVDAEEVADRVRVLDAVGLVAGADVELGVVDLERAAGAAARVVVVVDAAVERDRSEGALEPAVEVHLQVGAVVEGAVDVRVPVADVEARRVADVEAALERRLLVGLRDAAEAVVAEQAGVAGDRPVGLRRLGCRRRGLRLRSDGSERQRGKRERALLHGNGTPHRCDCATGRTMHASLRPRRHATRWRSFPPANAAKHHAKAWRPRGAPAWGSRAAT